ncbi:DUF4296 domain-containing protein [Reichenbachiella sp. MALMAid0571]|uniref:DUF4296 domain-containing protein n=1 Tax=Reichenbachiella sp. MALMAid0571 TaxID=3143939 RepID=UPI0032DF461E
MKNIFLVILILMATSCTKSDKKPENLLSREKMVSILIDVHILESEIQTLRLSKDSSQLLFNTFERELFEKHQVKKEVYKKSFEYYLEGVKEMEKIYEVVIDSLNYREKSADAKPKSDSLKTNNILH